MDRKPYVKIQSVNFVRIGDEVAVQINAINIHGVAIHIINTIPKEIPKEDKYCRLRHPNIVNYILFSFSDLLGDNEALLKELNEIQITCHRNVATLIDGCDVLTVTCSDIGLEYTLRTPVSCYEFHPNLFNLTPSDVEKPF